MAVNLEYTFEKLFKDPAGAGYPRERAESQGQSRKKLAEISKMTHKDLTQILLDTDSEILKAIAGTDSFMEVLEHGGDGAKNKNYVDGLHFI